MSTDVLFGQAYFLRFDPKLWDAGQPYAPLGALYAAAVARQRGYSVALFDAMLAESEAEWATALDHCHPRIAVIYEDSFNYLSKMCLLRMRQAALTMIADARARGITVLVAGSDASDHPDIYLGQGAAAIVAGEGEITLAETLDVLTGRSDTPLTAVNGLVLQRADGRLTRTRVRETLRDLDQLPFPAWDLVDVDKYRGMWRARHGYFSMNLSTTRGCPYHCNWCAKPIYGQRYTARSVRSVVEEIAWLKATYQPDHLWIADDIFGLKPGWVDEFAAAVVDAHAIVPFKCLMRADNVTERSVRALAQAGCRTVWIGAESGSQRILDAMEKGTTVEQIRAAAARLHAAGLEVGFFLQFGYPGETIEDIRLTRAMVKDTRPDDIGISVSYPLPGTPFYERVRAQLGAKQNWVDSDDLAMMYRASYAPAFYRELHSLVHAEYRVQRATHAFARIVRGPKRSRAWHDVVAGALAALRLPLAEWRTSRLSHVRCDGAMPLLVPVLSPKAAATPTDSAPAAHGPRTFVAVSSGEAR